MYLKQFHAVRHRSKKKNHEKYINNITKPMDRTLLSYMTSPGYPPNIPQMLCHVVGIFYRAKSLAAYATHLIS